MIIFTLSMPSAGSWNDRWSGEGRIYARARKNCQVPKEVIGKSFCYRWDDGWVACVQVEKMDYKEAQKIMKKSCGFFGYDWMIESIIKCKKIINRNK